MTDNIEKYKQTIAQIEDKLQDITTSLTEDQKANDNYYIIPRPNHEKQNLRLYTKNTSDNTSLTIYQSATTQGVRAYDALGNEIYSYVQAIKDGKKNSILSCADKTKVSEKSKLNTETNCFEPTYITETHPNEDNCLMHTECTISRLTANSIFGHIRTNDREFDYQNPESQQALRNTMLHYYYILNSTSILDNMKSLKRLFTKKLKKLHEASNKNGNTNPDTSDIENR